MSQKKSQSVGTKGIAQVKRSSSPKRFYLLLLTALLGLLLFVTYYASQQIQIYQSKAAASICAGFDCTPLSQSHCAVHVACCSWKWTATAIGHCVKDVKPSTGTEDCNSNGGVGDKCGYCIVGGPCCSCNSSLKCNLTTKRCYNPKSGGGKCTNKCTAGAKKCTSGNAQVCQKQSTGCTAWTTTKCANGCSNGVCKKPTSKPPSKPTKCTNKCTAGAKKCTSGNAQVCQKQSTGCTAWTTTTCKNGCSNGACKTAGGGKCTSIRKTKECNDTSGCKWFNICSKCDSSSKGTIEVCGSAGGKVCPEGQHLPDGKTDPADCVPDCTTYDIDSCLPENDCFWDETAGSCKSCSEQGVDCTAPDIPETGTATLALTLSFQGINQTPISGETTMDVLVTLAGGPEGQEIPSTGTFTVDSSGKWTGEVSFDELALGGDYKVLVKGPKHIQKKICDAAPSEAESGTYHCGDGNITISSGTNTFDFSGVKLLVGDLAPQDGIVDSYDISLIRNSLCTTDNPDVCKDSSTLSPADLNLDGIIDTQDHSLLISSLSIKYDEK